MILSILVPSLRFQSDFISFQVLKTILHDFNNLTSMLDANLLNRWLV
jgi:hypothetical protein